MALDLPWDGDDLKHMKGSPTRLDGIDVYYDFSWFQTFRHAMAQFPKGQCAARQVHALCPPGKTPALLLTKRDDVAQGFFETPRHLVLVLQIAKYLDTPADPVLSYLAGLVGSGITRIGRLSDLADVDPDELRDFLELRLNAGLIREWVSDREDRLRDVRDIPGVGDTGEHEVSVSQAIEVLRSLDDLPPYAAATIAALFGSGADREQRLDLVRAITEDPTGTYIVGEVLAARAPERIAEARRCMAAYQELLDDPSSGETDMQEFIETNLWLLGFHYAKMVPQQPLLGGWIDFALERVDGFQDVLELKNPGDPIVRLASSGGRAAAPPPSAYTLSPALAQSLAQVHSYRDRMTRHAEATEDLLGVRQPRDPWIIILIGKADPLPEHSKRVLTELNKSLHRVEVVPYDVLAKRARATIKNLEGYLAAKNPTA